MSLSAGAQGSKLKFNYEKIPLNNVKNIPLRDSKFKSSSNSCRLSRLKTCRSAIFYWKFVSNFLRSPAYRQSKRGEYVKPVSQLRRNLKLTRECYHNYNKTCKKTSTTVAALISILLQLAACGQSLQVLSFIAALCCMLQLVLCFEFYHSCDRSFTALAEVKIMVVKSGGK